MSRFQHITNGVIISVADDKDERFGDVWKLLGADAPATGVETPDKSWKVSDLKAYAEWNGIDLFDSTKKDDILAAIEIANES